jgi:hypothetical protein
MIHGKTVGRVVKIPANGLVREVARTPAASEFASDTYVSPARTRVSKSQIAHPEVTRAIRHEWQSSRMRALAMSSDLAMYAAVRVLQAEGRHSQALDIANAVLAAQVARPSSNPARPDLAASRAIIADLVHTLRRGEIKEA